MQTTSISYNLILVNYITLTMPYPSRKTIEILLLNV